MAIEVKSEPRCYIGRLSGLRAIEALAGMVKRIPVYDGRRSFRTADGIDVWIFDRLRHALARNALWPCV